MTAFLIVVLLILVATGWLMLRDQIQGIESRLRWSAKEERKALEIEIAALAERVRMLEQQHEGAPSIPVQATRPAEPFPSEPAAVGNRRAGYHPAPHVHIRRTGWSDRLRRWMGNSEWEALVAGSLLNKVGALIFVIGIALFLGYSFRLVHPAGRAVSAALISISILAGGVILERRQGYRLFSMGLIGAGWAALYTTAYAIYALPAAQIISNPFAGSILLVAVSAGMIAHSLRYRAQAVTAVAYFSAFAALAVTPSTPFAAASLIPLSASLLYFAWRFKWHAAALFGVFATYATCISRGNANAALWATTSLLLIYWLVFELFDILRARRGVRSAGLTWMFPLNAIAFLTLMYRTWSTHAPQVMWQIAAISAVLFFGSASARTRLRPASTEIIPGDPFECIRRGTYEAPVTIGALLAGLAILGRVTGFWTNAALAFEAEILYLAGVRFQSRFLRGLGRSGFFASLSDALATALGNPGGVTIWGVPLQNWTPSAIVHISLFYVNRRACGAASGFSFAATGLAALVILSELGARVAPLVLFFFGLALLEFALRKRLMDFRLQGYLIALAAVFSALRTGGFAPHAPSSAWGFLGICAIACWLFTARILAVRPGELVTNEIATVRDVFAICGSGFALLVLWMVLPGPVTVAPWTCLALVWLAIGSRLNLGSFRWLPAGVLGAVYIRLLAVNLSAAWTAQNAAERWLIPLLVNGALYYIWHVFRNVPEYRQRSFAPAFTWLAAFAAVWLLDLGVDRLYAGGTLALFAVALLVAGLRLRVSAFRRQSYLILAVAVVFCAGINFTESSSVDMFARISGASLLVGCLFATEFLLPRNSDVLGVRERHARMLASLAAMSVLTALLYHEVSGGLLTVAWGFEAAACLGVGFPVREKILRLQGLGVFALCILKLFVYDLRNLETAYRILSFIALGAILLGVSLIYTRFRTRIQRYL